MYEHGKAISLRLEQQNEADFALIDFQDSFAFTEL